MRVIIKSQQNYQTHIEEYKEEFECSIEFDEHVLIINFEKGSLQIEDNKLIYIRGENKIVIEPKKVNECDYVTEYGMFVLDIKGLSVRKNVKSEEELRNVENAIEVASARYEILITGVEPYENSIQIEIVR